MKTLAALLVVTALPALAHGEVMLRWTNANGTRCYTNRAEVAPPRATPVETRLIVEAEQLPGAPDLVLDRGTVRDVRGQHPGTPVPPTRTRRIYSEERLRFGCYASNILFSGGWSHPDDITVVGNCLPYLLGPEAWLNAARAELGLREHGLDWRALVPMYLAQRRGHLPQREAAVRDARDGY